MKDRKRVLTVILVLIVIVAVMLTIVLVFGGTKNKQVNDYYETLEETACKYATDNNYTANILKAYSTLSRMHYDILTSSGYIDGDLTNPLTNVKVSDDTKSYIEIKWVDGTMICTHKEG